MCILSRERIRDGVLQGTRAMPFTCRADAAIAADLVDAPVYFQRIIVRIAKLDRDLTSSAAPPLKIDLRPKLAQAIARGDHLP